MRLPDDLGKHEIALVNFVFTTCSTVCPMMGASFAQLSKTLETDSGRGVGLFSVTLDPALDTPAKLKGWAANFKPGKDWSLLTGSKADVSRVLKACGASVADKTTHSPFVLIGNPARNQWLRLEGTPSSEEVLGSIAALRRPAATPSTAPAPVAAGADTAQAYFPDVTLTNQDGKKARLYTDLLKDRVVVMNAFFASCNGVCSMTMPMLKQLQGKLAAGELGERAKTVRLLSFTVDPEADTTALLKKYSESMGAKPGWDFLTGEKQALETALTKLGFKTETKETHGSAFIVGNVSTGRLAKVPGYVSLTQLEKLVKEMAEEEKK